MQVYLCSTIGEIHHRLAFPKNPLGIFGLVNLYRPQNWKFSFHFDVVGQIILDIEFGLDEDPFFAISSGMLGVLDCNQIEVKHLGKIWKCEWQRGSSHRAEQNVLEFVTGSSSDSPKPAIRLLGFAGAAFPRELSRWESVELFFHENTWMGSNALPRGRFAIEIAVFDNRRTFRNYSVTKERLENQSNQSIPTLTLSQSLGSPVLGEVHLLSSATDGDLLFRWTHSGSVASHILRDKLGVDLSRWPVAGVLEVTFPSRQLGPDGTLAMDDSCQSILAALKFWGESLRANAKVAQFIHECEEFEKKTSARRIDQRKDNLLQARFVYYKNALVYKLPTSEIETVSLHQKLEGMGGLPFAEFVSLEYTPKLGIDAIVNFRVLSTEAVHRFATVEFEHQFGSFFAHSHPVEQTDMIICWEGVRALPSKEWRYEPDNNLPWLGYLYVSSRVIKVAQVSKYPGLEFKGIEGKNYG